MRAFGLRRVVALVAVALVASLPAPVLAAGGLITDACGVILAHPGFYRVATARQNCNADGITVNASNVTLDLGGRVIRGDGSGHTGILIASGKHGVVVQNGTISGFQGGVTSIGGGNTLRNLIVRGTQVNIQGTRDLITHNVSVGATTTGLGAGVKSQTIHNLVVRNLGDGLQSEGAGTLDRNTVVGNLGRGIQADDLETITHNLALGNAGIGIHAGGGTVLANRVVGNGSLGIEGDGRVVANVVKANADKGIFASQGSRVRSNVVTDNGTDGIAVSLGPNNIVENVANGNLNDGISGAIEHVLRNTTDGNVAYGVDVDPGSTGTGTNRAADNGSGCTPSGMCVPHATGGTATPVVVDCTNGTQLSAAGTYRLVRSVKDCGATTAVHITASNVVFDLGGHVIDGTNGFAVGVSVDPSLSGVVVENGTVSDWLIGATVSGIRSIARHITARNNHVGIAVDGGAVADRDTSVLNSTGLTVDDDTTTASNDLVAGNTGAGIASTAGAVRIAANKVMGNGANGIDTTDGNHIIGNLVVGNAMHGINAGANSLVSKNRLIANGGAGAEIGDDSTAADNIARGNGSSGLVIGQRPRILRNMITGNDVGMVTGNDAVIIENVVNGNLGNGIMSNNAVIRRNTTNGNEEYGIFSGGTTTGGGNTAKHNGGAGGQCFPAIC